MLAEVSLGKRIHQSPLGQDETIEVIARDPVAEIRSNEAVVIAIESEALSEASVEPYAARLIDGSAALLIVGELAPEHETVLETTAHLQLLDPDPSEDALMHAINNLIGRVELWQQVERANRAASRSERELAQIIEIARALTQERDLDRLLELILDRSRFLTSAEAGSIYVVEGDATKIEDRSLRFKLSQNDAVEFESQEFTVPISRSSIAGCAVLERLPIRIRDAYDIGDDQPFGFDKSFDKKVGFRTQSMLTVPLISSQGEVIGVIQLINKRPRPSSFPRGSGSPPALEPVDRIVPFEDRDEELALTFASQAGIALENAILYEEIRRIFDGFVRASVQAIEQRDPTTSGHSQRVSTLCMELAKKVDHVSDGPFAETIFTRQQLKQLEYAALLHDFGKIGVREEVLIKAKKLYPYELEKIRTRFDFALTSLEKSILQDKLAAMRAGGSEADLSRIDERGGKQREYLIQAWRTIEQANEPTILAEGDFSRISEYGSVVYTDARGDAKTLLTPREIESLQVRRGSLNDNEMNEIRSHVVHTVNFLEQIPWGREMNRIAEIAGAHHEKLDGSGYPHGKRSEDIAIESRIMTVADIFDALTARDRPYKRAVPLERALTILDFEVKDGHVDAALVEVFRDGKVYQCLEDEAGA